MTDSAYDVILKNHLVLLPEAIVCEKTLHAHAVSCIAGGPWPALPGHGWPGAVSTPPSSQIGRAHV